MADSGSRAVDNRRKRKAPDTDADTATNDRTAVNSADDVHAACGAADTSVVPPCPTAPPPPPLFSARPRVDYLRQPPDFVRLARLYPAFAPFVQSTGSGRRATVDFHNPAAITALTRILLLHDFQLTFELPPQHLCPPVPQRLAVLYWVDDILSEQRQQQHWPYQSPAATSAPARRGIDVGCGASVIFPLLAVRSFGWQFVATEVDPAAITAAAHNIAVNQLQHAIQLRVVADRRQILVGVIGAEDGHFDCLVCNPPFFSSPAAAQLNPHRTSAATLSELCYEGGEVAFVRRLYSDSVQLRRQVDWFTCMIGAKKSWKLLRAELVRAQQQQQQSSAVRGSAPCQIRTTTFVYGKQTRWGLAWTFNTAMPQRTTHTQLLHRQNVQ